MIIKTSEEIYLLEEKLTKVRIDKENWLVYYLDERTKEKWVKEYPYSEMHAGGPPQLRKIEKFPWE